MGGGLAVIDDEHDEIVVTIGGGDGKPSQREKLTTQRSTLPRTTKGELEGER
jgi:hypothetical protein